MLDRGHGIKPEHMGLLFNSFFTTRPKGMGLGLSIVRSIVDAHHGRVWAEHFGSGGTAVQVVLPVGQSHLGWSRPTALRR